MIYILFILLTFVVLAVCVYKVNQNGISQFFTNIIVLSSIFFFIIHIALPTLQWNTSYFRYGQLYSQDTYIYSILLVFLLHCCFLYGINAFSSRQNHLSNIHLNSTFLKRMLMVSVAIFCIGAYFSTKNLVLILSIGFEKYLSDRISIGLGNGLGLLLAHWTYISCLLFFFIFLHSKNAKWIKIISLILFLSSFLLSAAYYGINSNRNSLFILLISLLAFGLAFSNKYVGQLTSKQLKKTISISVVVLIVFSSLHYIGELRHQGKSELSEENKYGIVKSLNGAFGNHENIVWLMSNEYELELGSTYTAAISNFIPRSIWPNKPLGAGPKLKNFIYPGSYVVGRKGNSSLTTGFYTELVMNFGIVGALAGSFLFALFFSLFLNKLGQQTSPALKLLYLFSIIAFATQFFYAEFLGFFARYIFSITPFIIIHLATRTIKGSTR